MKAYQLEKRTPDTKAKALRRAGYVPCSICGRQMDETIAAQMSRQEAMRLYREKSKGGKVELCLDDKNISAIIKQVDADSVKNEVEHVSFQMLPDDKKINGTAQILIRNREKVSGSVTQVLFEVPYTALPADIVEKVEIDVSALPSGTKLAVRDLPALNRDRIELLIDPGTLVVKVMDSRRSTPKYEE